MLTALKFTRVPPNTRGGYNSVSYHNLTKDLSNASITSIFSIMKYDSHLWKRKNLKMIRFICCSYRKFRGNTGSMDSNKYNFCCHDFHNDQKNSCGKDGIHYQQKTWTKQSY